MSRLPAHVAGAVLLAASAWLAWTAIARLLAVDACLDAGGSFDHARGLCDLRRSHPVAGAGESAWRLAVSLLLTAGGLAVMRPGRRRP